MNAWDALLHLLNFVAPALALALSLPGVAWLMARVSGGKRVLSPRWLMQTLVHLIVGSAVLVLGLWFFGRDGKMATYAALVLVMASTQWLMGCGWRR